MTASIFLAAFVGCLFAFVVIVVLAMQFTGFFVRRFIKRAMPEILHQMTGTGHPATGAFHPSEQEMEELASVMEKLREAAKHTPPGVAPHLPTIACVGCKGTVDVPYHLELIPHMKELGWTFKFERHGWVCQKCA